ncbi:MAG TPA: Rieske 2Fe-2S domain-containing protein [Terriglobales bacterium]|nr:Rieske 2Fe-2S domain-containing protein [Terriglobales bacterium]
MRGGPEAEVWRWSLLVSLLGVVLLGISGWPGGTLVFRNQIGVDHRYANAAQFRERELASWNDPACNTGELGQGQMMLLRVRGERVVIGRCSDGIVAFSDRCTHRGGPLSDGALVGCTVQCPWHGSQFDVHTGRVVTGPAKSKIEAYETEVRGGEVYVAPRGLERKAA